MECREDTREPGAATEVQEAGNNATPVRPVAAYLAQLEERIKAKRSNGDGDGEEGEETAVRPPISVTLPDGREVELPASVVRLKSRLGGDVFLIGSAHVSQASVDDVTTVIERVRPNTVFVELCPSRAGIIFAPTPQQQQQQQQQQQVPAVGETQEGRSAQNDDGVATGQQNQSAQAMREEDGTTATSTNAATSSASAAPASDEAAAKPQTTLGQLTELLRRRKEGANILHLVISLVFERVVKNVKVMPGSEFRAAAQEGMKYGARVVLGDRPVEITLKRTWGSLSLWEKLKLLYFIISDTSLDIKEEDIERMKNSDLITEMIKELSSEFPSLVWPLITERDQYLACKLRACPGDTIVAVVGMGHVAGMVEWWDRDVDLRAICVVPPPGFFTLKRVLFLVLLSVFMLIMLLVWFLFF